MKKTIFVFCLVISLYSGFIPIGSALIEQSIQSRDLINTNPSLQLEQEFRTQLFTGSFTYFYPFELPPGVHNLAPHIQLAYVSQKTSSSPSLVGTGWDITENYVQRRINSTTANSTDDSFVLVLDGTSYDLVYSISEGRYHTKIESFLSIEQLPTQSNELGTYWLVRTPKGVSYRFGFSPTSELVSNLTNLVWRWSLDLVNDTLNNSVFYTYAEDPFSGDGGTVYPTSIMYNNDQTRKILFGYETRTDIRDGIDEGLKFTRNHRLRDVSILVNNQLVRRYYLQYEFLNSSRTSLINNITLFGSDNSSVLPPTLFEYNTMSDPNWTENDTYAPPMCFTVNIQSAYPDRDYGAQMVDINGDGFSDVVRAVTDSNGNCGSADRSVFLGSSVGWKNGSAIWDLPPSICLTNNWTYTPISDRGYRFVDVNGDGFVDLVRSMTALASSCDSSSPGTQETWLNTGAGWLQTTKKWIMPTCISIHFSNPTLGGKDLGTRFADVNGDGLVDVIRAMTGSGYACDGAGGGFQQTWLNNGTSGWITTDQWKAPECFVTYALTGANSGIDLGTRLIDANGDGLIDIIRTSDAAGDHSCNVHDTIKKAFINYGNGSWVPDNRWAPPICMVSYYMDSGTELGARLTDLNGDGLIDLIRATTGSPPVCPNTEKMNTWISTANGWLLNETWNSPVCFTNHYVEIYRDLGIRLADVNGDGQTDILNHTTAPNMSCFNNGRAFLHNVQMPFLLRQVTSPRGGTVRITYTPSTRFDNVGNDSQSDLSFPLWVVSSITAANGLDGEQNTTTTITYNYSGGMYNSHTHEFRGFSKTYEMLSDGSEIDHYFHQDEARSGREYRSDIHAADGTFLSQSQKSWGITPNIDENQFQVNLVSENTTWIDNNPRSIGYSYQYDQYGNPTLKFWEGDLAVTGDERNETTQYVYNTSAWLVSFPSNAILQDSSGQLFRNTTYVYDSFISASSPTKGLLFSKQQSLGSTLATTLFTYDSFGNTLSQTDSLGHMTSWTYGETESTSTLPDQQINALNHTTHYTWDLGLGKQLSQTDPNGFSTNYTYDAFGRLLKEVRPYDSLTYPTKSYTYETDGIAPESTMVAIRENNGTTGTYDTYQFTDGLGRVIQTKTDAEESRQIITDTYYDSRGRILAVTLPYFNTTSVSYNPPSGTMNRSNFTYDALGRQTQIRNPDGTFRQFVYSSWNTTTIDERLNQIVQTKDAFDQVTHLYERNVTSPTLNLTEGSGTNWWNSSFTYRQRITIGNPSPVRTMENGTTVFVVMDTTGLSYNETRIVSSTSGAPVEIDRVNTTPFGTTDTILWFRLTEDLSASMSDDGYWVYYASASPGQAMNNWSKVFIGGDGEFGQNDTPIGQRFGWKVMPASATDIQISNGVLNFNGLTRNENTWMYADWPAELGAPAANYSGFQDVVVNFTIGFTTIQNAGGLCAGRLSSALDEGCSSTEWNGDTQANATEFLFLRTSGGVSRIETNVIVKGSRSDTSSDTVPLDGTVWSCEIQRVGKTFNRTCIQNTSHVFFQSGQVFPMGNYSRVYAIQSHNDGQTGTATGWIDNVLVRKTNGYQNTYNLGPPTVSDSGPFYPISTITRYSYDAAGDLLNITDTLGNNISFTYDLLGRKTSITDPDLGVWNYTYDLAGNMIRQQDAENDVVDISYDPLNRPLLKNSSSDIVNNTYDLQFNGTLSRATYQFFEMNYTYDNRLRVIQETSSVTGNVTTLRYVYDSLDRLTNITLPNNDTINQTWSAQNTLNTIDGIIQNIDSNELGLPQIRSYANGLLSNFTYARDNLRLSRIRTTQANTPLQDLSYTYDATSNPTNITDSLQQTTLILNYDALNRLVAASRNDSGPNRFNYSVNYTYDEIGRILNITINSRNTVLSYHYNVSGPLHTPSNITQSGPLIQVTNLTLLNATGPTRQFLFLIKSNALVNVTGVNWTFWTGEQVIASNISVNLTPSESIWVFVQYNQSSTRSNLTQSATALQGPYFDTETSNAFDPDPNATQSLQYDKRGNLINDTRFCYVYNNFNQLKRIKQSCSGPGASVFLEEYRYDASGQRVFKLDFTTNTTTYYLSKYFIREVNASGNKDTVYYYDQRNTLLARKDPDGKAFFYHPDHLGSTTLVTNQTGQVVEQTTYFPYGQAMFTASSRYLYTGKELDRRSEFEYYGARYYNPPLGIFTQADSMVPNPYNPQALNRYAYTLNSPFKYTDPDGHSIQYAVLVPMTIASLRLAADVQARGYYATPNEVAVTLASAGLAGLTSYGILGSAGATGVVPQVAVQLLSQFNMYVLKATYEKSFSDIFGPDFDVSHMSYSELMQKLKDQALGQPKTKNSDDGQGSPLPTEADIPLLPTSINQPPSTNPSINSQGGGQQGSNGVKYADGRTGPANHYYNGWIGQWVPKGVKSGVEGVHE